jgi:VanZ family protein
MSIKSMKICGVTVLVLLLLFCALGPSKWQVRTGFGWRIDHVVGYFAFTVMFCLAWPRPLVVGGVLMASAMLLEALQALTPDRCCDFEAALYGVSGALLAAVVGDLFVRLNGPALIPRRFRALVGGVARASPVFHQVGADPRS